MTGQRIVAVVGAAVLFFSVCGCQRRSSTSEGRVLALRGSVALDRSAGDPGVRTGTVVRAGMAVRAGDRLSTAEDSSCDVATSSIIVRLGSQTALKLTAGTRNSSGDPEFGTGTILVRTLRPSVPAGIRFASGQAVLSDARAVFETGPGGETRITVLSGTAGVVTSAGKTPFVLKESERAVLGKNGLTRTRLRGAEFLSFADRGGPSAWATRDRRVQVSTLPAGARVFVSGAFVGNSPVELASPARGRLPVSVELGGYGRIETNIFCRPKDPDPKTVLLRLSTETDRTIEPRVACPAISCEPVFLKNSVYIVSNRAVLRRFSLRAEGRFVLQAEFNPGGRLSKAVVSGDLILIAVGNGILYGLDAESLQPVWRRTLGEIGAFGVDGGFVYAGTTAGFFYSLRTADGFVNWKFKTLFPVASAVAIADSSLCFETVDRSVIGLDRELGTFLWRVPADRQADPSTPVFADGRFVLLNSAGVLSCFSEQGWRLVVRSTGTRYVRAILAAEKRIYSGSVSGTVRCFKGPYAAEVWKTDLKSGISSGFLLVEGALYAGLRDGRVVRIDPETGVSADVLRFPAAVKHLTWHDGAIYVATGEGIYRMRD